MHDPSKHRLLVGAGHDCDIQIQEATVSGKHCELLCKSGNWILTDLNSTNGTFVNGTRITTPCTLNANDEVTLGRGIRLTLPPVPAEDVPCNITNRESVPAESPKTLHYSAILAGSLVLILFLLVGVIGLWNLGGNASDSEVNAAKGIDDNNRTDLASTAEPLPPSAELESSAKKPENSGPFWAVVAQSADGKVRKLIGNAVAVGPNRLVTLASVVEALDEKQGDFAAVFVMQTGAPAKSMLVTKKTIHPNYRKSIENLTLFESELRKKIDSIEMLEDPPLNDRLEWSGKFEAVMQEISRNNLATLETAEQLAGYIPVASPIQGSSQSERIVLSGFPVIVPTPDVRENLTDFFLEGSATIPSNANPFERSYCATEDLAGVPLLSLACVSSKGEFVGLISNQEPELRPGSKQMCRFTPAVEFWK